jgi:AcrR family transcriptional regulator
MSAEHLRIRADARRNRERVLLAARDVFAEKGTDAPLEEIAARAGVGIATLYRRFPERTSLVRAVALDLWTRSAEAAEQARVEEPDAFRALARYLHRALDLRVAAVMPAVMPALAERLAPDVELRRANDRSAAALQALLDAARAEGTLRPDAAFGDVGLLLVRLSRPLPGPFPRPIDDALAHRHLQLATDGLRAGPHTAHTAPPLPGPALSLDDLRGMRSERRVPGVANKTFGVAPPRGATEPEPIQ